MLKAEQPDQAIVFVRTKIRCDQLYRKLRDGGMNVRALHGDMTQGSRDGVMLAFKGGRVPVLVATDVASRGLDISTVTHVINYDVPVSPDVYVHRIGRTGRVGRSGRAITFVESRQKRELEAIERHIGVRSRRGAPARTPRRRPVQEKPRRHSKPHHAAQRRRARGQAAGRRPAGPTASRSPTSSTPSPPPPGVDNEAGPRRARARALLAAVGSRPTTLSGSSTRSTARDVRGVALRVELPPRSR